MNYLLYLSSKLPKLEKSAISMDVFVKYPFVKSRDFWHPKLLKSKFLLLGSTNFVVTCCSSSRKLIHKAGKTWFSWIVLSADASSQDMPYARAIQVTRGSHVRAL